MPLIKSASKKALKKNIEMEMEANPSPKDRAQNLAIAYSVQKNARKKHMNKGGVPSLDESVKSLKEQKMIDDLEAMPSPSPSPSLEKSIKDLKDMKMMAHGGKVCSHCGHADDIDMEMEGPATNMEPNIEAKEWSSDIDEGDMEMQPMDSNQHGDEISHDEHDMVAQIRKKMKMGK